MLPFWSQATFVHPSGITQLMGAIALNLFGLVNAFLHLLLRANGKNMLIGPGRMSLRRDDAATTSTGMAIAKQISKPITIKRKSFTIDKENTVILEKELGDFEASGEQHWARGQQTNDPTLSSLITPTALSTHARKRSDYSIFPTTESSRQTKRFVLHLNDSKENLLRPPESAVARPQRVPSNVSAATVQIGLRLSNIGMAIDNSPKTDLCSPRSEQLVSPSVYTASVAPTSPSPRHSHFPNDIFTADISSPIRIGHPETYTPLSPTSLSSGNTARKVSIRKPPDKPKIAEQNKIFPPPLVISRRRDQANPKQPSPLRVVNNTLPDGPRPKKPWPLPEGSTEKQYTGSDTWI